MPSQLPDPHDLDDLEPQRLPCRVGAWIVRRRIGGQAGFAHLRVCGSRIGTGCRAGSRAGGAGGLRSIPGADTGAGWLLLGPDRRVRGLVRIGHDLLLESKERWTTMRKFYAVRPRRLRRRGLEFPPFFDCSGNVRFRHQTQAHHPVRPRPDAHSVCVFRTGVLHALDPRRQRRRDGRRGAGHPAGIRRSAAQPAGAAARCARPRLRSGDARCAGNAPGAARAADHAEARVVARHRERPYRER